MPRTTAPAQLRLLGGVSPGRDSGGRLVAPPPPFRRIPPKPPTTMSREGKAEWRRVVPGLTRLGLLKEEDRALLAVYCETWARWCQANKDVQRNGFSIPTAEGGVKRNPALTALETAATQLRMLAQEFGLSPAAESRLAPAHPDDADGPDNPFA